MEFTQEELDNEIWKDIPEYEGYYQVSNLGRVKSLSRTIFCNGKYGVYSKKTKEKFISFGKTPKNYCFIYLQRENNIKRTYIHRLVLSVFIKKGSDNNDACHNDGNPLNNRLKNLRWDTRKGNEKDKIKHHTQLKGNKHPNSKLNNFQVRIIRYLLNNSNLTQKEIGNIFGVTFQTVSGIKLNRCWNNI